jgi:RNA polymerase sigma factor (sigma-70 family)
MSTRLSGVKNGPVPVPASWSSLNRVVEQHRPTDAEIIRSSRREPEVFEDIYRRHADAVYRFAMGRVGPVEAQDVVADTFVRAFGLRHRYRDDRPHALPWLFGVAANVMRERNRRILRATRAHRRLAGQRAIEVASFDEIAARVDAESNGASLHAVLAMLSDDDYRTLMLVWVAGLTYAETAEVLDIPIGTVRSRLSRIRTRLREQLEADRPTSFG